MKYILLAAPLFFISQAIYSQPSNEIEYGDWTYFPNERPNDSAITYGESKLADPSDLGTILDARCGRNGINYVLTITGEIAQIIRKNPSQYRMTTQAIVKGQNVVKRINPTITAPISTEESPDVDFTAEIRFGPSLELTKDLHDATRFEIMIIGKNDTVSYQIPTRGSASALRALSCWKDIK